MKVSEVSIDDGKQCAILISLLKKVQGLSGEEAPLFMNCKKWVHDLAVLMAAELKPKSDASSDIKIKAKGKIKK